MIAKYDGKCKLSGKDILAGASEIEKLGTEYVLSSERNGKGLDQIIAERISAAVAMFGNHENRRGRKYADVATEEFESVYSSLGFFKEGIYGIGFVLDKLNEVESEMLKYYNELKREGDI